MRGGGQCWMWVVMLVRGFEGDVHIVPTRPYDFKIRYYSTLTVHLKFNNNNTS